MSFFARKHVNTNTPLLKSDFGIIRYYIFARLGTNISPVGRVGIRHQLLLIWWAKIKYHLW